MMVRLIRTPSLWKICFSRRNAIVLWTLSCIGNSVLRVPDMLGQSTLH